MTHLIFLPGASGSTEFWQPLIELLSADYTVQVIAYPGFGAEPAQTGIYNFASLSEYVLEQIQKEESRLRYAVRDFFAAYKKWGGKAKFRARIRAAIRKRIKEAFNNG